MNLKNRFLKIFGSCILLILVYSGCAILTPKKHKKKLNIYSTVDSLILGFKERDTTILKKYVHEKIYLVFLDVTDTLQNDDEVKSYIEYFDRDWEIEVAEKAAKIYVLGRRLNTGRHYHGINNLIRVNGRWVITCHLNNWIEQHIVGTCAD